MKILWPAALLLAAAGCHKGDDISGQWQVMMPGAGEGTIKFRKGTYSETLPTMFLPDYKTTMSGTYELQGESLELLPAKYEVSGPDKATASKMQAGFANVHQLPTHYSIKWSGPDLAYLSTQSNEVTLTMAMYRNNARPDPKSLRFSFSMSNAGAAPKVGKYTVQEFGKSSPQSSSAATQPTDPNAPPPIPEYHPSTPQQTQPPAAISPASTTGSATPPAPDGNPPPTTTATGG